MRVLVRILACLLGLAVAAAGALLAVEVAWAWIRPRSGPLLVPWPQWRDRLSELTWGDSSVQLVAWLVVVAALLLLLFAVAARRREVRLNEPAPEVTVSTTPRSLARLVGHRVRGTEGVSGATVAASAKALRVRVNSRMESERELRPKVLEVTNAVVDMLPLPRKPKITVVVDSLKDRP